MMTLNSTLIDGSKGSEIPDRVHDWSVAYSGMEEVNIRRSLQF